MFELSPKQFAQLRDLDNNNPNMRRLGLKIALRDAADEAGHNMSDEEIAALYVDPPPVSPWAMIEALRKDEGHSVELICDNPDFNNQPNSAVICCGDYTGWKDMLFTGDTVALALRSAYDEMQRYNAEEANG